MMYFNPLTSYQCEHVQVFCHFVDNNFATITQDWVIVLYNDMETLYFHMVDTHIKLTFLM